MADYISREAVEQVLRGIANGLSVGETEALKVKDLKALYKIQGAKEILNSVDNDLCFIPAADVQPVNQWISIDERLPQDGEEALVYAVNRGVMIGLYDSVLQVWLDYECCGLKVTHWQPLPEPPKKEE